MMSTVTSVYFSATLLSNKEFVWRKNQSKTVCGAG